MRLGDLHKFFIQEGIAADPRKSAQVEAQLRKAKSEFRKLKSSERKFFDREKFWNPYADSRILNGDPEREIKRIMVGIDIDVSEILMAKELSRSKEPIDLVLAHHPIGIALAGLCEVMDLQTDVLKNLKLPSKVAEGLMNRRIAEVSRRLHSDNHTQTVDAARLLEVPLMSCHTPTDNHVTRYLQQRMDQKKPKTCSNVVDLLLAEPEYRAGAALKSGPTVLVGGKKDPAGRILVDMTGGTEGSKEVFARLSQVGINTLLCMHLSEQHFTRVKTEFLNVVNAGHMASDNLGINLLLDKLQKKTTIDIVECSGFKRFRR